MPHLVDSEIAHTLRAQVRRRLIGADARPRGARTVGAARDPPVRCRWSRGAGLGAPRQSLRVRRDLRGARRGVRLRAAHRRRAARGCSGTTVPDHRRATLTDISGWREATLPDADQPEHGGELGELLTRVGDLPSRVRSLRVETRGWSDFELSRVAQDRAQGLLARRRGPVRRRGAPTHRVAHDRVDGARCRRVRATRASTCSRCDTGKRSR